MLAARVGDHRNDPELEGYTPGSGPGVWIPTPPAFANPQTPFLQFVTPFGYDDPARFRPHAPPALDSRTYTIDYNEIKDLGRATDTSRTAEQSATALFWSPSASALWSANVRSLASSMDLLTAARFEAIGIAAVTNALIAVLGCEVHVHVLAPGYRHPCRRYRWQPRDRTGSGVDTLHRHAVPPRIPRRSHDGRRGRARVLHGVVRHRSVPAGVHRATAARFVTTPASTRSMPRKATRACGAGCTGATAPRWVPRSAAGSAGTRHGIFSSRSMSITIVRDDESGLRSNVGAESCRRPRRGSHLPAGRASRRWSCAWRRYEGSLPSVSDSARPVRTFTSSTLSPLTSTM